MSGRHFAVAFLTPFPIPASFLALASPPAKSGVAKSWRWLRHQPFTHNPQFIASNDTSEIAKQSDPQPRCLLMKSAMPARVNTVNTITERLSHIA